MALQPSDLGLLVTLDALLQEGSVTGAARRLGLSAPATSHALARIRVRLGDPILVRAGRGMVLTPRAQVLRDEVRAIIAAAGKALDQEGAARDQARTFVVHVTDYVLTILGIAVDRFIREAAPHAAIQFVPNTLDDAALLQTGASDLAVGIYGELPEEMRSRRLLTDRFVCVARAAHPSVARRLSFEQLVALPHIQIAPRGKPGGYIDDMLAERGARRHVARAVPYFLSALQLAASTDYLLVISERIAQKHAPSLGLVVHPVPLELRPYALSLMWHPRVDADPANRVLRDAFVRAAQTAAADVHDAPRTRLERTARRPRRR